MADEPTFKIPREVIEPVIKAQVAAAVEQALGGGNKIMEQMVASFLTQPCDASGRVSTYSSDNKYIWIEAAAGQMIKNAFKEMLQEELAKHQVALKKMLIAEMRKTRSPLVEKLAEAMVSGLADSKLLEYRLDINVAPIKQRY